MCTLIIEIVMLASGIYALIAGKIKVSQNFYLEGWRARVAGLFLIAPLPLAFLAGIMFGVLVGTGTLPPSALDYAAFIEIFLMAGALAGVVIFALIVKPKEEPVSTERIESLEE